MRILCIGNSFSVDATRYLHKIGWADRENIEVHNLYIGGCSLAYHYNNMLSDNKVYSYFFNGNDTGFKLSLKEALLNQTNIGWDYITFQQASHLSVDYESYQPYLCELYKFVKKYAPKAKIAIHETWAYEEGSEKLNGLMGYNERKEMAKDIVKAYEKAAKEINADVIIRCGELFEKLFDSGFCKLHRDTFHADLNIGRYALGLLWYKTLTGKDIMNNTFCDLDEEASDEDLMKIKKCVSQM